MNTASYREDIPNNYHLKGFSTCLCIEEIEICEEKLKMTLSLNVLFNGSAINMLVSRDEATLGPSHLEPSDGR
jgi:hypothetical protein